MKIFLSYGHDQNAPLVERIKRDLEAEGYQVWIDTFRIKGGHDWRRSIHEGLLDSDYVLSFLSKHSARDPGVCLDELAIALHEKGGTIATVLVESEREVQPPVSVSHIQWLDMHDWAERELHDPSFHIWYRKKFAEIRTVINNPDNRRFAGEIKQLQQLLQPVEQYAEVGALSEGFVGRDWLNTALDQWRKDPTRSRLFWLFGQPGSGKSAFAAWLAHRGRLNVIGINLCSYNKDDPKDAGRVIRTLAFQISTRLPDYRSRLLSRLLAYPTQDIIAKPAEWQFSWLLMEPLRILIDGGRTDDRYLVIIDGLDETIHDGRSELAEILAEAVPKLPRWIAFLATSRPEHAIWQQLSGFEQLEIKGSDSENLKDLREYVAEWLGSRHPNLLTDEGLLDRILSASEGNFLYVRSLREAVDAGTLRLDAADGLPRGLVGLYARWFARKFPQSEFYWQSEEALSVLVASTRPIPLSWLERLSSAKDVARLLEQLGGLIARGKEGVAPFHKSLRDWLTDPNLASSRFFIDPQIGGRVLGDKLWAEFLRAKNEGDAPDEFCVAELPNQLVRSPQHDNVRRLKEAGGWTSVRSILFAQAREEGRKRAWRRGLSWCQMIAKLAEHWGSEANVDQAFALTGVAGGYFGLGFRSRGIESLQASQAINQALLREDPDSETISREIAVTYNRLAPQQEMLGQHSEAILSATTSIQMLQDLMTRTGPTPELEQELGTSFANLGSAHKAAGNLEKALAACQQAVDVAKRLCRDDHQDARWQTGLASALSGLGDIQNAQGYKKEALQSYEACLGIQVRITTLSDVPRPSGLAKTHHNIGNVLKAMMKPSAALKAYEASREALRESAASDPDDLDVQHDLAIISEVLGDHAAAFAITERLAKADPSNARWQSNWASSLERAGLAQIGKSHARAAQYLQVCLDIAQRLAAADPENPEGQRRLADALSAMGELRRAEGDRKGSIEFDSRALVLRQRLARSDPTNANWQEALASCHENLSKAYLDEQRFAESFKHARENCAILAELITSGKGVQLLGANHLIASLWVSKVMEKWIESCDAQFQKDQKAGLAAYNQCREAAELEIKSTSASAVSQLGRILRTIIAIKTPIAGEEAEAMVRSSITLLNDLLERSEKNPLPKSAPDISVRARQALLVAIRIELVRFLRLWANLGRGSNSLGLSRANLVWRGQLLQELGSEKSEPGKLNEELEAYRSEIAAYNKRLTELRRARLVKWLTGFAAAIFAFIVIAKLLL